MSTMSLCLIPENQVRRVFAEMMKNLRGLRTAGLAVARLYARTQRRATYPKHLELPLGLVEIRSESEIDFVLADGIGLWIDSSLLRISDGSSVIEFGATSESDDQPWQILTEKPSPWLDTSKIADLLHQAHEALARPFGVEGA